MKALKPIPFYYYRCRCNDTGLCIYYQRFMPNSSPSNEKLEHMKLVRRRLN